MKDQEYIMHAPKSKEVTIQQDEMFPNKNNYPGDSVNEHERIEDANALISEKEIEQQRENL